jgi:hypothetical protein
VQAVLVWRRVAIVILLVPALWQDLAAEAAQLELAILTVVVVVLAGILVLAVVVVMD